MVGLHAFFGAIAVKIDLERRRGGGAGLAPNSHARNIEDLLAGSVVQGEVVTGAVARRDRLVQSLEAIINRPARDMQINRRTLANHQLEDRGRNHDSAAREGGVGLGGLQRSPGETALTDAQQRLRHAVALGCIDTNPRDIGHRAADFTHHDRPQLRLSVAIGRHLLLALVSETSIGSRTEAELRQPANKPIDAQLIGQRVEKDVATSGDRARSVEGSVGRGAAFGGTKHMAAQHVIAVGEKMPLALDPIAGPDDTFRCRRAENQRLEDRSGRIDAFEGTEHGRQLARAIVLRHCATVGERWRTYRGENLASLHCDHHDRTLEIGPDRQRPLLGIPIFVPTNLILLDAREPDLWHQQRVQFGLQCDVDGEHDVEPGVRLDALLITRIEIGHELATRAAQH